MSKKKVINSCDDCDKQGHSGAFTDGGAIPLCHGIKNKGHNQFKRGTNPYRGSASILPMSNTSEREYTGEIPNWCPLQDN